jgi:hypothetical protein
LGRGMHLKVVLSRVYLVVSHYEQATVGRLEVVVEIAEQFRQPRALFFWLRRKNKILIIK